MRTLLLATFLFLITASFEAESATSQFSQRLGNIGDARIVKLYNYIFQTSFQDINQVLADNTTKAKAYYDALAQCKPGSYQVMTLPPTGFPNELQFITGTIKGVDNSICNVHMESMFAENDCQTPLMNLVDFTDKQAELAAQGFAIVGQVAGTFCSPTATPIVAGGNDQLRSKQTDWTAKQGIELYNEKNNTSFTTLNDVNQNILKVDALNYYNSYFRTSFKNKDEMDAYNEIKIQKFYTEMTTCSQDWHEYMDMRLTALLFTPVIIHHDVKGKNNNDECMLETTYSTDEGKNFAACTIPAQGLPLYSQLKPMPLGSEVSDSRMPNWIPAPATCTLSTNGNQWFTGPVN